MYPIGIQDFRKLREMGYKYVDKTQYVRLMVEYPRYYFLSRPRRFGKSLFLTTLEAYFEGRRELFNGLSIDTDDMDWTPRPVIKISLNTLDPKSEQSLAENLNFIFSKYEQEYGIDQPPTSLPDRFLNILQTSSAKSGRRVAVLVDEYDAPILATLDNDPLNEGYRKTLKSIFSVLKDADEYIFMAFVTGVSRFSHTSLFSGANNLTDISLDNQYAAICGITEEELKNNFESGIHEFALSLGVSDSEMLSRLKDNYDGYHFSETSPDIYNPFSLLNSLAVKKMVDYWFQSGTPQLLLTVLKREDFYLPQLDCIEMVASDLSARESYLLNPVSLLFETGYLTIKSYDDEMISYLLGLPNQEVAVSFSNALLPIYSGFSQLDCNNSIVSMRRAVIHGDPDKFLTHLRTFLQGNPYSNTELKKRETYFKNNIFLVLKTLGFRPRAEEQTCNSRMDLILRTRRFIYIFELKTDGNTAVASAQINERGYALPYLDEGRKIFKIAANYSSKDNNLDSWVIEEI